MRLMNRRFFAIAGTLCFLCAPTQAIAEKSSWNQKKVTAIAVDFSESIAGVLADLGKAAEESDVIAERQRLALSADVKRLQRQAGELAAALKEGAGRDESAPRFRAIQEIRETARKQGRRVLNPDSPAASVVRARALLAQLQAYYENEPGPLE